MKVRNQLSLLGRYSLPTYSILYLSIATLTTLGLLADTAEDRTLTLAEAEQAALSQEPAIVALQIQADAYNEVAAASSGLPFPFLSSSLMNYPLEHGGFRTEAMTQLTLGLRMHIPPGKQRSAMFHKNENLAREKLLEADARSLNVLLDVRTAWLDAYYWEQALEFEKNSRRLFNDLVNITRSLYAVGSKNQDDVLGSQLQLHRWDDRLLRSEQSRTVAYAGLAELMDMNNVPSVSDSLPDWGPIPELEELRESLVAHPSISAIDARSDVASAEIQFEEGATHPSWNVDVKYGYRDGGLPTGVSRSDVVSASISFNVPLWGRKSQDLKLSAAKKRKEATDWGRQSRIRDLDYQLNVAHSEWSTLTKRLAIYEDNILSESTRHAEASLASYRNDTAELSDVVLSYIKEIDSQLAHIRLKVDRLKVWAKIDSIVDLDP